MRSLVFPYFQYRRARVPIICIEIKGKLGWTGIWVYVDSGASISILSVKEAARLDIEYEKGK